MSALSYVANNDLQVLQKYCSLAYHKKQYDLEAVDKYGNTALLKACFMGRMQAVKILLHFGASINALNYFGQNALTLATYSGHYNVIMELLKHRSYSDFNLSSVIPARCVATLRQDQRLMQLFAELDWRSQKDVVTAHGLSPNDLQTMINMLYKSRNS